ncbi:hypothetical protein [Microbaculum sp. FT89]|uniref:hypothetical protein n=1 Tax=Microbaculum sp. FT89 TaxID=3447298 RepID=UPI003F52BE77
MANPLLIGGLVMGGAVAAWRLMREHGRGRSMFAKLLREPAEREPGEIVHLERDPATGVYRPQKKR